MANKIIVKIWIDDQSFTTKPNGEEIAAIRGRQGLEHSYDYTLDEIAKGVNGGHTFTLAELKEGGKSDKDFVSQQIFGVDIDNKDEVITVDEAKKICSDNNLKPCLIYNTFSHTEEHPKFRILFAFDKAETDKNSRDQINQYLIKLFNGDQACKDASRLFFGGKAGCVVHKADVVNSLDNIKFALNNYNKHPKLTKEVQELCRTVDFKQYIADNCNGEWEGKFFNPCPICGHNGDFTIDENNNFTCYSESGLRNNGKHPYGNFVSFAMETEKISEDDAITKLYQLCGKERPQVETETTNPLDNIISIDDELYLSNYQAAGMVKSFWTDVKTVSTKPIPTGFTNLDKALDGGLPEGLIVLGALSSLGKTTYVLQMADQIAANGKDVIIISLEMSKYELIAKSVSRNTYKLCGGDVKKAKTTFGITKHDRYKDYSNEEKQLITQALKQQYRTAKNIYIFEGLGDVKVTHIEKIVIKHINIKGNTPVVIIDYLQILAPYNDRWTEKQNIDKSVLELKRISRDNKIPVIAISSFNRANYSQKEAMMSAFKESGAIEYGSDILMALQFREIATGKMQNGKDRKVTETDIEAAKARSNEVRIPREVEIKILKNRNGQTGCLIPYNFYPAFNYFTEDLRKKPEAPAVQQEELSAEDEEMLD